VLSNGKIAAADCSYLCVFDSNGDEYARFTGKRFRAAQDEDGSISVWQLPNTMTQDGDARPCRDHSERLAALNARNADFWARRDAEV